MNQQIEAADRTSNWMSAKDCITQLILGMTPVCWDCETELMDLDFLDQADPVAFVCGACKEVRELRDLG